MEEATVAAIDAMLPGNLVVYTLAVKNKDKIFTPYNESLRNRT